MNKLSPLNPPLLTEKDTRISFVNLKGSSASLTISHLTLAESRPFLLLTPDIHSARRLEQEILFFSGKNFPILYFPDWETLPYDHFSPHQDLISERLLTLYQLPLMKHGIIIAALPTLMQRLLPREYLQAHTLVLKVGDFLDSEQFRQQCIFTGYRSVTQVMEHGEFAQRGAILDIFPMGSSLPFRIELFDNEVESIRTFDPNNQRSLDKTENIRLLPAHEYPLTAEGITQFRQAWRAHFEGNPKESVIYENISAGTAVNGAEYYLPLFFSQTQTFFEYLPPKTALFFSGKLSLVAEQFWQEIRHRYEQLRHDITRPLCAPETVFIPPNELFSHLKGFQQIHLNHHAEKMETPGEYLFDTQPMPSFPIDRSAKQPLHILKNFLDQQSERVLFCAESTGRREIVTELLKDSGLKPQTFTSWQDFLTSTEKLGICVAPIDEGLWIQHPPLILITESQLFGDQVMQRRLRGSKKRQQDPNAIIRDLTELQLGAAVVHHEHGVGRYRGLQVIKMGDQENEYLTLEYADSDLVYVPVTSLHWISRYTGVDAEHAPLHKLGSKQWQKAKRKAAEKVRDVAAELLEIYSRRQASQGFAFQLTDESYQHFSSSFPFEETPDQTRAIHEVFHDMTSTRCMDRLVCGDVGFGKTEVALRATFLAVQNHKQVVVLVPTTLLANQHLQNFQDRFADWPFKVAGLSRLRSQKEQKAALEGLANGKIDIVIGTHKLLHPSIQFKDLGLLIVDEEHRFGVQQKERIKALRAHIDILTLTATPIPRTLNIAFAGVRDLSLMTTPPAKRLSVRTFVHTDQSSIIREAILREILRGGQVYYLYNEVSTIQAAADRIKKIVSEAHIGIAHGQLPERVLEKTMADFYHQRFNVLVCSTIIESGIDIPSANTIVIHHADRFGLAQLHQLRGRVGRSHHQAYAYLLIPEGRTITRDAEKRLEALSHLEDLGSGFQLATHDLEIRGAGELLGEEQSGHMHEIGFSLYMELLEEAVQALREGREPILEQPLHQGPEINLNIPAFIPETYVPDIQSRLTFYKRLSHYSTVHEIEEFKVEMIDRFGLLPSITEQLFMIALLKLKANNLGIHKIDVGSQYGYLHFIEKPSINPAKLIELIQKKSQDYQLQGPSILRFRLSTAEPQHRVDTVMNLLKSLS